MSHEEQEAQKETIITIAKHVKIIKTWWPIVAIVFTAIVFIVDKTVKITTAYDSLPKKEEVATKKDMQDIKTALDTLTARQKVNNKKLNVYITQTSIQTNKFRDSINQVVTNNRHSEEVSIGQILSRVAGVTETHKIKNGKVVETTIIPN